MSLDRLFDAMVAAGWLYEPYRDRFVKGDLRLTRDQAQAAMAAAERGEEWIVNEPEPANDDASYGRENEGEDEHDIEARGWRAVAPRESYPSE